MMTDILVYESGTGGDLIVRNNDLVTVQGYENQPYIANFGGSGGWADTFLTGSQKHTSQTEAALLANDLNSAGRIAITNAISDDLQYLVTDIPGTVVNVQVSIPKVDRLDAFITIGGLTFYMNFNPDSKFLNYTIG
jgi:hypothetical protein